MKTQLTGYHRDIVKYTKCKPIDAEQIEEVMRSGSGGTLDHLTATSFATLARASWEAVKELREDGTYDTP